MIQHLERIEQRAPHTVRSAIWGGLHVPHAWCGTELLRSVSRGWLDSDLNPVCSLAVYLALRQETLNDRNVGRGGPATPHPLRTMSPAAASERVVTPERRGTPVCSAHSPEAPSRPEHAADRPTARPPNRYRQDLCRVEGTLVGPCEVLTVQMTGCAGAVRRWPGSQRTCGPTSGGVPNGASSERGAAPPTRPGGHRHGHAYRP
jgi:hypothetical protein